MKWKLEITMIARQLHGNSIIPKGWGLAYRLMDRDIGVFMPIPINIIVQGLRKIWWKLLVGFKPSIIERIYDKGLAAGRSDSIHFFTQEFKEELPRKTAKLVLEAAYEGTIQGLNTKGELMKIELLVGEPTAEAVEREIRKLRIKCIELKEEIYGLRSKDQ